MNSETFYTVKLNDIVYDEEDNKPHRITQLISVGKSAISKITQSKYGRICTVVLSTVIGMVVYVSIHYAGEPPFKYICKKIKL